MDKLFKIRLERFNKLKKMGLAILSFWDALFVPFEEKQEFINLVYYVDLVSADEINEVNGLSLEFINKVEQEYHRLGGQLNVLILKKKSKIEQIMKSTHLTSPSVDEVADTSDPIATLADMRAKVCEAKALASERADFVTKIELLQHASKEVLWCKASKKDGIPFHDARGEKARILEKALPKILIKLKAELTDQGIQFKFDGMDAKEILDTIEKEHTDREKATTLEDKAGTSAGKIGTEATDVEDMQLEPEQPEGLLPLSLQFGRKAPRTPRVPVQAPSPPDSNNSDESMMSGPSDPDDPDYIEGEED